MRRIRLLTILEVSAVLIYLIITLFSITIQPVNLILGIFCTLIIPGYNLINTIKPKYKVIQKLGYMTILSLAIVNIFMFFTYFFLYDLVVLPEDTGFFFDPVLLISSIQILNLILIVINKGIKHKNKETIDLNASKIQNYTHIKLSGIFKKNNLRSLVSYFLFFFSLIFLCVSTVYSEVPNNDYSVNYVEYRSNFTFFLRVPLTFYLFLIISILSLTFIIFSGKNNYIKLSCISIFLYCLWILPYLQIGNFFNHDSKLLFDLYQSYLNLGISPAYNKFSFTLNLSNLINLQRYSTSIFTTILLTNATQINISFVLWFIYPLSYISIPFFFYSVFQKYSTKKEDNSKNLNFFILTILAILTPQFIKFGRSPTTGVIGTYIFFILILEFYSFTNEREFNKKQVFFISFLFFFLSITHTEECIYFLLIIIVYSIFQILAKHNHINKNIKSEYKKLRKFTILWASFLILLFLIFYFTQEFFGWVTNYIDLIVPEGNFPYNFILNLYSSSKFTFIINLENSFTLSYGFILLIPLGIFLLYYIYFLFLSNFNKLIPRINNFGKRLSKFFYRIIKKVISKKYFLIFLLLIIYGSLIIFEWLFFPFFKEEGVLLLFELAFNSSLFVIDIYLFIFGLKYYRIKDYKQNYFLIAIFSSSLIFSLFFLIGNYYMGLYTLTRFFSFFVFFNLIVIEETYIKNFMKKNKIFIMILVILLLSLGVIYSLRTIAYG